MFPGICLNCLVILSFWRSRQLAKKLCYFTVMILSCCDVIVVLTSHPLTALACYVVVHENVLRIPEVAVDFLEVIEYLRYLFLICSLGDEF